MDSGVLIVGSRGELAFASERAVALLGERDAGSLAARWAEIRAAFDVPLSAGRKGGESPWRGEVELVAPAGAARRLRVEAAALGDGRRPATILQLSAAGASTAPALALRQAARLHTGRRVLAGLAHDVRGPLNALGLNFELLKRSLSGPGTEEGEDSARRRRYVEAVEHELGRLGRAFERFVEETAEPPPEEPGEVDLAALVAEVADLLATPARKARSTVRVTVPERPIRVRGARSAVREAILHVVVNALEALESVGGGEILLDLTQAATGAKLTIRDDGPGIGEAELARVFDPRFTTKTVPGGLGLAVAHSLVDAAGGSMAIASVEGEGTEITLELPPAPGSRRGRRHD